MQQNRLDFELTGQYSFSVSEGRRPGARDKLIAAGTDLIRRNGYNATSVDSIVEAAGVSKGTFFYHFDSKEALTAACLHNWDETAAGMMAAGEFMQQADPVQRLQGCLDHMLSIFSNPQMYPSCLAGTTVQEVSASNDTLRSAAQACFANTAARLAPLITEAGEACGRKLDGDALAGLWMATLQGSLVLAKASGDPSCIPQNLRCQHEYIMGLLE